MVIWISLIPMPQLDGGRILRLFLPPRADFALMIIGFIIGIVGLFLSQSGLGIPLVVALGTIFISNEHYNLRDFAYPFTPLPRSRRLLALNLVGLFVLLWPLTYEVISSVFTNGVFSPLTY
jgi:membrane-associated protease RseP (regulator of RpoE activity)